MRHKAGQNKCNQSSQLCRTFFNYIITFGCVEPTGASIEYFTFTVAERWGIYLLSREFLTCFKRVWGDLELLPLGNQLLRIWNVCHQSQLGGSETEWLPFHYRATLPRAIPIHISLHYSQMQQPQQAAHNPAPQAAHNPAPQARRTGTTGDLFGLADLHCSLY
jgi:hypothetical protein